ncbi:hypothetical protein D3C77_551640 [compost metagenome]
MPLLRERSSCSSMGQCEVREAEVRTLLSRSAKRRPDCPIGSSPVAGAMNWCQTPGLSTTALEKRFILDIGTSA